MNLLFVTVTTVGRKWVRKMNKHYTQDEVNELILEFIASMCEKEYRDEGVSAYMLESIGARARELNSRVRMSKYE